MPVARPARLADLPLRRERELESRASAACGEARRDLVAGDGRNDRMGRDGPGFDGRDAGYDAARHAKEDDG
jgi:hypothetical protein